MKKYLALIAACAVLTTAASCGIDININNGESSEQSAPSSEETSESTAASDTEETTETSAETAETSEKTTEKTSSESSEETKKTSAVSSNVSSEVDPTEFGYRAQVYYGTRHNRLPEFIDCADEDDGSVTIHLYDIFDGHTATYDWYYIDKKTGKGTNLIGDDIDLYEEPTEMWDPEVEQRNELKDNDCFCGIVYLGNIMPQINEYHNENVYLREMFSQSGVLDKFGYILGELPEENWASTELGEELYLVIPRQTEACVKVTQYDFENDRELGNIYSSYNGSPFLLKCNYSDISSDVKITVTDNGGQHETFSPYISLRDGEPAVTSDRVFIFEY